MHLNIWIESNRKKRGLDFMTKCGYAIERFHGLHKKDIAFFYLYQVLSIMIDNT